ncbi:GNAT family N-acetyltransferase [Thalassobacillus sp. CUG 92003]|uniref:GNAT family N-acetyltransferase n=1 Tax=Thalassobacillus sp. CUG 92003 TaxID=2736641 RepID=UPI0015E6F0DF|nr:GNAT family N-acetyltransferase [Thalassobacillus sp. CUG 92003]
MISFHTIDPARQRKLIIQFRKDSFVASFGHTDDFGSEAAYIKWMSEKVKRFPNGFVLVWQGGEPIGQLELQIKVFQGIQIGYVSLYYLIPSARGKGAGHILHEYAMSFFNSCGVKEYHLRVAPSNERARRFYKKSGLVDMYPEFDGKVMRMKGYVS